MDWLNINLSNPHERSQSLLDALVIEDFIMEAVRNLPVLDEDTLTEQFKLDVETRVDEAVDVFESNLPAFLKAARALRAGGVGDSKGKNQKQ